MSNDIKREMKKIKIPEELHERSQMGIKQVKSEKKRKFPRWILSVAATFLIAIMGYSFGGPYLADAAESLMNKIFGSEVQDKVVDTFPKGETEIYLPQQEQHLELAREHLTPEEFEDYGFLLKEMMEIDIDKAKNPNHDNKEREKRERELQDKIREYGIYDLTVHTIEEARGLATYPINRPAYIPSGYELYEEEARTEEANVGVDPEVVMKFRQKDGEFGFRMVTGKIDRSEENELGFYENTESYQRDGYDFDYAYDDDSNVEGMSITLPDKGYQIIMIADILPKEEMEKVLLSTVKE